MKIDLNKIKNIHVVGAKGSGVIALVELLISRNISVTGSDVAEKFFTDETLKKLNVSMNEGFSSENVPTDCDLVLYSTAYSLNSNAELIEANRRAIPIISYPELLAQLFNVACGIAVCGTHGKTTTTAMLGMAMEKCGLDPSVVVGSRVIGWNGNTRIGQGKYFLIEADEYQNKLSLYTPQAVILSSVDYDHPDFFPDFNSYKEAFKQFVAKIPRIGSLIVWGDSVDTREVAATANCSVVTYGFGADNDYQIVSTTNIENRKSNQFGSRFIIKTKNDIEREFKVWAPGKHNVLNATATIALIESLRTGCSMSSDILEKFRGTARRFEFVGKYNGSILIDDYAHHPEEIKATLRAAKEIYPDKRIITIFHPHTFSRTKALLQEFSQSFDDADKVYVLNIYGSAREIQGSVQSEDLVALINRYNRDKADHVPTISDAVDKLKKELKENDVLIVMGAGNVWEVASKLKE